MERRKDSFSLDMSGSTSKEKGTFELGFRGRQFQELGMEGHIEGCSKENSFGIELTVGVHCVFWEM